MPVTPQRPAGCRIEPPVSVPTAKRRHASRHRGRRTAARAAGDPRQVPGIARHLKSRVLVRAAHGELVEIRLADQHGVGRFEPLDDGGVVRWDEVFQHPRSTGGRLAGGAQQVLERDRQAGQAAERFAGFAALVDVGGSVEALAGRRP